MAEYNTTQLDPEREFSNHVFHRDQFAHYLRWTHVLKISKIGNNILDLGCGTGNLAEVLYRNKHKCTNYLGIDIRKKCIEDAKKKFENVPWITFEQADLIKDDLALKLNTSWDIITCFEVVEHVNRKNVSILLEKIKRIATKDTIILISTPCYDEHTGAANNHIIDGIVQEWTYQELYQELDKHFEILNIWGTFASQKDYKKHLNEHERFVYDKLSEYYDSNIISNLFAPLHPELSRNCLWKLRRKIK